MSAKKSILTNIIVSMIIGLILGVLLICLSSFLDVSFLIKWALIITGIIVIISNIPALIGGIMTANKLSGIIDLIFAALGIVLGIMMIFMQGTVMTVIVSVYLIAFPIVRVITSGDWKNQIKKEWLRILIGALLLAFLPALISAADAVVKAIILVAGWAVVAVTVISFVLSLVSFIVATKKAAQNPDFLETTAEDKGEE